MSDYYEDEWYDPEPEIDGWSEWLSVYKAKNGHVVIHKTVLVKWDYQDWGEAESREKYINLNDLKPLSKANALALARNLQPNEACDWEWLHISNWIMYLSEPLYAGWQNDYLDYFSTWGND